jgi:hypothetical protein
MKAKLLTSLIAACALAGAVGCNNNKSKTPGNLGASNQPGQGSTAKTGPEAQPAQPGGTTTAQTQQIQGTVKDVDVAKGEVTVTSNDKDVTLHALPTDLADLNKGQQANLSYANFGGELWVTPSKGGAQTLTQAYQQTGTITGSISKIDKNAGTVTINGQKFYAHPDQLQGLASGQFVSLSYANVQGTPWVANIQQGQPGQQGGGSQGTPPEQQPGGQEGNQGAQPTPGEQPPGGSGSQQPGGGGNL